MNDYREIHFGNPIFDPITRRFTAYTVNPVPGVAFWTHDFYFSEDFMSIERGLHTAPGYEMEYGVGKMLKYKVIPPRFAVL
jgi:hypothetical protein